MTRGKKKKRRLKIKALIVLVVVLAVVGVGGYYGYKFLSDEKPNIPQKDDTPKEPTKKTYEADLIMVGDALIHSSVYQDANRNANWNGYDFNPMFDLIKEKVNGYDLAYYNQETILGGTSLGLSSYPCFNSPQQVGDAMVDAGFNLVSMATNHTVDSGESAVLNSRAYWNKQKGVLAVGSYSSAEEKKAIESKIYEVNGITYAFLNYTYGTNGIPVPYGKPYLVNLWDDENNYEGYKATVKADIAAVRDKADVVIVAMHWGREYTHEPTYTEKVTAEFLASLNVDIIIGTHPHVIQPVTWVKDTLVFYSLGNFISAQYQNADSCTNYKCMVGLMSSLTITKTVENNETTIEIGNVQNDLTYTYYSGWANFKVIPFSNPKIKNYASNYQYLYNTYSKIIESSDDRISTVPLGA